MTQPDDTMDNGASVIDRIPGEVQAFAWIFRERRQDEHEIADFEQALEASLAGNIGCFLAVSATNIAYSEEGLANSSRLRSTLGLIRGNPRLPVVAGLNYEDMLRRRLPTDGDVDSPTIDENTSRSGILSVMKRSISRRHPPTNKGADGADKDIDSPTIDANASKRILQAMWRLNEGEKLIQFRNSQGGVDAIFVPVGANEVAEGSEDQQDRHVFFAEIHSEAFSDPSAHHLDPKGHDAYIKIYIAPNFRPVEPAQFAD